VICAGPTCTLNVIPFLVTTRATTDNRTTSFSMPAGYAGSAGKKETLEPLLHTAVKRRWQLRSVVMLRAPQGLVQMLEAAVTRLESGNPYVLAFSHEASGACSLIACRGFPATKTGGYRSKTWISPRASKISKETLASC
jgi:hypothetical protein